MKTEIKQILIGALEVPMDVQTTNGICDHITQVARLTMEQLERTLHLFKLEAARALGYPLEPLFWLFPLDEEGGYTEPEWDCFYEELTYKGKTAQDIYEEAVANADHPLWEARLKLIQDILRNLRNEGETD